MYEVCVKYEGITPYNDRFLSIVAKKGIDNKDFSFFTNVRKVIFLFKRKDQVEDLKKALKRHKEYHLRARKI